MKIDVGRNVTRVRMTMPFNEIADVDEMRRVMDWLTERRREGFTFVLRGNLSYDANTRGVAWRMNLTLVTGDLPLLFRLTFG